MRTHRLFAILAVLTLFVPGCAGLIPQSVNYQGMSADQIAASVKDKNSAANCSRFIVGGQTVESLTLNNDAGVVKGGTATIKCGNLGEATFTNGEVKK